VPQAGTSALHALATSVATRTAFARTRIATKIGRVTPSHRPSTVVRGVALVALSAAGLTLVFTAQDVMRRSIGGFPVSWPRSFAINALDWAVWAILLPLLATAGRRIRLDDRDRRGVRVVGWFVLALAFCAVQSALTGLIIRFTDPQFFGMAPPPGQSQRPLGAFLVSWGLGTSSLNLLIFGMTAGALHAIWYSHDLRERRLREVDLQARLAAAELSVLRTQLQPHFLFNALHTVSSLMLTDVAASQRVIASLGDLLRLSLEQTAKQEVPLADELTFVVRYLDVQRARFRNRLDARVDVPESVRDALVPSLVLQPLVENAVRHAVEPSGDPVRVWISAERVGDTLTLVVRNDGASASKGTASSNGIGLSNLEARLRQLYGTAQSFRASSAGAGEFVVTLTLPFRRNAGRAS